MAGYPMDKGSEGLEAPQQNSSVDCFAGAGERATEAAQRGAQAAREANGEPRIPIEYGAIAKR